MRPTVALVGASGHGRRHLVELLGLHSAGLVELLAVVDTALHPDLPALLAENSVNALLTADLAEALACRKPATVVISTPPHTHAGLAAQALAAGCSVYLEKPPVPLVAELDHLVQLAAGQRFEVGFQQTPGVVSRAMNCLSTYDVGRVERVTGFGALQRSDRYYSRASWVGRRELGGQPVFDGALFNPLAHVIHAALAVAQSVEPDWAVEDVSAELAAVRDIQADDLAALRVDSLTGPVFTAVGTTASDRVIQPGLLVVGSRGRIRIRLRDLATTVSLDESHNVDLPPVMHASALREAVIHPNGAANPLLDAVEARPFVSLVAMAVALVPEPVSLGHKASVIERDGDRWTALPGVADAIEAAADNGTLLRDQPLGPWNVDDGRVQRRVRRSGDGCSGQPS